MPDVRERLSTSCTKDLIGRRSESFPGSKEVAVVKVVDEVEEIDVNVCCAMGGMDSEIGDNCSLAKARGCF